MIEAPATLTAPWSERIFDRSPLSPFWSGTLLALALILLFVIFEFSLGGFDRYESTYYREDLRVAVVLCLLAAYLPAAWLYSVRSSKQAALELAPFLTRGTGTTNLDEVGRFNRAELRRAGFVGMAAIAVALIFSESGSLKLSDINLMSPEAYVHRLLLAWISWSIGRCSYAIWLGTRRFAKIGREGVAIDLLDLTSVAPLIRYGLRQALVPVGAFSLLAPMFYDAEAAANLIWLLLATSTSLLSLAAAVFLIPAHGARDAIRREKELALLEVNDRIRSCRAGHDQLPGLADWIAFRTLIESVREWPIDTPTLRRFALYLAIPLGSWLGGALVERMVDGLLD